MAPCELKYSYCLVNNIIGYASLLTFVASPPRFRECFPILVEAETMKSTQKGLVIYADDDPDDLYLVSEGFFKYAPNIDLITVKHGRELLDCLSTLESTNVMPCLIILDINMPGMDGKTALSELRKIEKYENTPVVLFSTSTSESDTVFAEVYNAGFVTKPRRFTDLNPIIERFFNQCSDEVRKQYYTV